METFFIMMASILVGATIGGITNRLAIAMLFRPFKPIYVGKWKLPFTPGLIPARHEEIARQLGHLVQSYLITESSIQQHLQPASLITPVTKLLEEELDKGLNASQSLKELLAKLWQMKPEQAALKLENILSEKLETELEQLIDALEQNTVKEMLQHCEIDIEAVADGIVERLINQGTRFLHSYEGEVLLRQLIEVGVSRQGPLGNMLGMLIPKEKVIEKLRDSIAFWLLQPQTKERVREQVLFFVDEYVSQPLGVLLGEKGWTSRFFKLIISELPLQAWLEQPLSKLLVPYRDQLAKLLPVVSHYISDQIYQKSTMLYHQLNIKEMVEQQVLQFPFLRFEHMIQDLARKELRMITWLGALLGGIIGASQAMVLLWVLLS